MAEPQETNQGKRAPLLDLDALFDRATIIIDGTEYELRNQKEFSIFDFRRMGSGWNAFVGILNEEPSDEQEPQLRRAEQFFDDTCRKVLVAPDELHSSLTTLRRQRIVEAFFGQALVETKAAEATVETTPKTSTGEG